MGSSLEQITVDYKAIRQENQQLLGQLKGAE